MQMTECESSHIKAYGYDHTKATLAVLYKNGSLYHWQPVDQDVYIAFVNAESKGKFIHGTLRMWCGDGVRQESAEVQ